MFESTYPLFHNGRILKKEMFENIRDFSKNSIDIVFKDYSDGIICGGNIKVRDNNLIVKAGLIKHMNKIYILNKDYLIKQPITNKETIIKVRFIDHAIRDNFQIANSEIFLDEDMEIKRDEIELGRFKKKDKLCSEYKTFFDFSKEYDVINIIHVKYSGIQKATISPLILKEFAHEMMKIRSKNIYDVKFCMNCMSSSVDMENIIYYLCNKLNMEHKEYSNEQIYKYFQKIIKDCIKEGRMHHGKVY